LIIGKWKVCKKCGRESEPEVKVNNDNSEKEQITGWWKKFWSFKD